MGNLLGQMPSLYVDSSHGNLRRHPKWPPKRQFSDNSTKTVKIKIRMQILLCWFTQN